MSNVVIGRGVECREPVGRYQTQLSRLGKHFSSEFAEVSPAVSRLGVARLQPSSVSQGERSRPLNDFQQLSRRRFFFFFFETSRVELSPLVDNATRIFHFTFPSSAVSFVFGVGLEGRCKFNRLENSISCFFFIKLNRILERSNFHQA